MSSPWAFVCSLRPIFIYGDVDCILTEHEKRGQPKLTPAPLRLNLVEDQVVTIAAAHSARNWPIPSA